MISFEQIIDVWPTLRQFAGDVGVPYQTAASWRQRDSIPSRHWPQIVAMANRNGYRGITYESLVAAEKNRNEAKNGA